MDPVSTVQTVISVVLTNVSVSEPEGGQGVEPEHGVPDASVHDGQMDPYRAVESRYQYPVVANICKEARSSSFMRLH